MKGNRPGQARYSTREGQEGDAARTKILVKTKSAAQKRAQQSTVSTVSVDSSKASKARKSKVAHPHGPHVSIGDISFRTHRSNSSTSAFESFRTCHHLLVRRTNENMGMVPQTVNSYEVCTATADRLFYVLESEHRNGSIITNGAALVLLMLAADGVEVIRIEGWGSVTSKARKLKVFKRDDLIGTVTREQACCWVRPYFTISDESGTEILRIVRAGCEGDETSRKGWKGCCPNEDDMQVYYDTVLPGSLTKTGSLGKANRILGKETLADLEESYGVELNGAMTYNQKSLLLASLFLVYRLDTLKILKTGAEHLHHHQHHHHHYEHNSVSSAGKSKRVLKSLRRKSKPHFFARK